MAPSALYHHVGGRDLLSRHVVGRVLSTVGFPTETMPWRDWFRAALYPARPVLAEYPGAARWLLLHGPVFPSMVPVVDSGIASLQAAGFAEGSAYAYTALFNTAMMTISLTDDRFQHADDGARDHATMMHDLLDVAGTSPGVALISRDVITQFAGDPDDAASARDGYYRYLLETLMDGLEHNLHSRDDVEG